jgi:mitochondrial GTPase 1
VGKLRRTDQDNKYTATVMLIGLPNVGKSALTNALHHVGRISAAGIQDIIPVPGKQAK